MVRVQVLALRCAREPFGLSQHQAVLAVVPLKPQPGKRALACRFPQSPSSGRDCPGAELLREGEQNAELCLATGRYGTAPPDRQPRLHPARFAASLGKAVGLGSAKGWAPLKRPWGEEVATAFYSKPEWRMR